MLKNKFSFAIVLIALLAFQACQPVTKSTEGNVDELKIVSLNGTVSEILVDLGFQDNLVGVDVSSNYPKSLQEKPKVGHSRQFSAEGILALAPDVVIATKNDLSGELAEQISNTGVKLLLFDHQFSPDGTKTLIQSMADSLDRQEKGDSIVTALQSDLEKIKDIEKKEPEPKVLFIYARGAGTMMVAGRDTQVEKMIELAGGVNAVQDFTEFKPLTAEALVAANPDVILLFDSGFSSLGGAEGLLEVQGVRQTNAGKNRKFVEMEGQLLTGFSQRLGQAVEELAKRIH